MEKYNDRRSLNKRHKLNHFLVAILFIIVGFLILFRNMGILNERIYHVIVSWQMFLVALGAVCLVRKNLSQGLVLVAVGIFFMTPARLGLTSLWPLWLILIGLAILLRSRYPKRTPLFGRWGDPFSYPETEEGFISSDVTFGGAKHVVLDPYFRGASLDVTFGGLVLDLRRTKLDQREAYVEINVTFGSVELFVPSTWNIISEIDSTLSGFEDKRFISQVVDYDHKLILRGDITFGSIDIKS